jgi:hypothetical protein
MGNTLDSAVDNGDRLYNKITELQINLLLTDIRKEFYHITYQCLFRISLIDFPYGTRLELLEYVEEFKEELIKRLNEKVDFCRKHKSSYDEVFSFYTEILTECDKFYTSFKSRVDLIRQGLKG